MRKILRFLGLVLIFALVLPSVRGTVSLTPTQALYGASCVPAHGRTSIAWYHNLVAVARCSGYFVASASGNTVVFITSGTTYTVPANFSALVSIEVLGTGASSTTATAAHGGAGGAGSHYAKITTLSGIAANNSYNISIGASAWFDTSTTVAASSTAATGSTTYAGGAGGAYGTPGGGGGGAAGPTGVGSAGVAGSSGGAGGAGDSYTWTATAGGTASPGTGGNGGASGAAGNTGGNYGGGGGGPGTSGTPAGAGGASIIVFTYTPTAAASPWQPFGIWHRAPW